MSSKYPGGIISKTAPTPSGPYADSTAPGVWTLEQQAYWQKLGQWPTAGNVNPNLFIENLFSTYLYTGTGAAQTITNGINLSANGGLVWFKNRNSTNNHALYDTARGATKRLSTSQTGGTGAEVTDPTSLTAFNSNGFSIGSDNSQNENTFTFASWTFREQPKFFDVVTYTGNGTAGRTVAHDLGSVPGCIIVKQTSASGQDWMVYHRSLATNDYILLNSTGAASTYPYISSPTSTTFTVESAAPVNSNGATYVAYLFAHNAGGFGLTGSENVISCGSFTTNGSGAATVTLGYEPQWVMTKIVSDTGNWVINDNMRGMPASQTSQVLYPNLSAAESSSIYFSTQPNATGFTTTAYANNPSQTVIYIAIRRGPMAVPTVGTTVFEPITWTGNSTKRTITGPSFPPDMAFIRDRSAATGYSFVVQDKLRGPGNELQTWNTDTEYTGLATNPSGCLLTFDQNGVTLGTDAPNHGYNVSSNPEIGEFFRRAPSVFDVVCYTGTGSATTFSHNLAVVPEMMIVKNRSSTANWMVYVQAVGNQDALYLNGNFTPGTNTWWNNTTPTASVFTVGTTAATNASGSTFVAYLFATCAGVSKVGSYTGTGAAQTINCGFTGGSRFVLIKRTDSTGDWYVWDSARGIVAGNDPYLLLNSTAAEVTGTDYVDTTSVGFDITSTAPAAINANGGTFIFLAIA